MTVMAVHFVYPSHPFDPELPDEQFREQVGEIRKVGLGVSLVSFEELGEGRCRIRGRIPIGATVVYRGWMLTPVDHENLVALIQEHQAHPLTSLETYLACHYLPNW
jgi:hypothetical protein